MQRSNSCRGSASSVVHSQGHFFHRVVLGVSRAAHRITYLLQCQMSRYFSPPCGNCKSSATPRPAPPPSRPAKKVARQKRFWMKGKGFWRERERERERAGHRPIDRALVSIHISRSCYRTREVSGQPAIAAMVVSARSLVAILGVYFLVVHGALYINIAFRGCGWVHIHGTQGAVAMHIGSIPIQ